MCEEETLEERNAEKEEPNRNKRKRRKNNKGLSLMK